MFPNVRRYCYGMIFNNGKRNLRGRGTRRDGRCVVASGPVGTRRENLGLIRRGSLIAHEDRRRVDDLVRVDNVGNCFDRRSQNVESLTDLFGIWRRRGQYLW